MGNFDKKSFDKKFKETLRALDLLDFLGHLEKNKADLLVEFFDIKPEKMNSISTALEARERTSKTIKEFLEKEEEK